MCECVDFMHACEQTHTTMSKQKKLYFSQKLILTELIGA